MLSAKHVLLLLNEAHAAVLQAGNKSMSPCPWAGRSQRNERDVMMNQAYGWMGGEMWMWAVLAVLVVVVVVGRSLSRK